MKLEIQNLSKSFAGKEVLKGLNLTIPAAKNIAIIGPSGGGKTTFLRILAGLEVAEEGQIILDEVSQNPKTAQAKRELMTKKGFVFQAHSLFTHMTILENITFPLVKLHQIPQIEAEETANELLSRFGLLEHAHKLPATLSGGQQQRAAIVRALALNTNLLLFDEPTSALDPILTEEVLTTIIELGMMGKEFIIVTHAIGFARDFADYVLFIDNGTIIEHGHDIIRNPKTSELKYFLSKVTKF